MKRLINGNELYIEEHGNPNGKAIFFIHGAPGLGDCRNDIKAFSDLGVDYRLIFMDMRGSGRSEGKPPFTHEQWTEDIESVRKELVDEPIIILGGSYGGFLALEYVLRYPESVRAVLLRDTAASKRFDQDSVQAAKDANLTDVSEDELIRLFAGEVASNEEFKRVFSAIQPLYTVEYDEIAVKKKMDSIYYRYETHNAAFKYNKPNYNIVDQLPSIKVPVFITVGRHDWITPVESSDEIASHIPNHEYHIFEQSGHSPHHEENELYLARLRAFLQKNKL
ncbi:alpha/beta fold hydrolase [Geomicrobium sp. JCM 19039]|uniref:alpha/beta fold hydrolase n=1 Tax=Geomicrobium sp. JCM 19039 TaxID=1460636 RepID=UPI00045F11C2|nr:alpha/beta hydrolase [Geomicrobium sp. JCM 19039]GAK12168.1 proline iminopeptidase [Geomicrobium sp. JCM 19039]